MRKSAVLVLVAVLGLALVAGGVYVGAGRRPGPVVQIEHPAKFVGAATPLEVVVEWPLDGLSSLDVAFEQDGTQALIYSLTGETPGAAIREEDAKRVRVTRTLSRDSVSGLRAGTARIVVTAERPVVFGLRHVRSVATRDVEVRLDPPRLSVVSTHHYVNLGGSEAIVYRVTPADARSGVIVGDVEYPGYPASGAAVVAGAPLADPALHIALFALRFDQPLTTPVYLFARDEAGNAARAEFDHRVFPKPAKASRIELTDAFLERVVPAIIAGTKEVAPTGPLIDQFVVINSDLRRRNADRIRSFAKESSPEMLWHGAVFHPFTNSSAESAFADRRTYLYKGREVDRQVHLGFDLASFAHAPIVAAGRGRVLFAAELGIYGNAVIIDHGMGLQSLYAHLSSVDVQPGVLVEKGQAIGKSGMTGLAAGDHLHFTMLLHGQMVNPVEWWDSHWIEDRILRKLKTAQ